DFGLAIAAPSGLARDRYPGTPRPITLTAGTHRHPHRAAVGRRLRRGRFWLRRGRGRRAGVALEDLVDRLAEDLPRVLERGDLLRPELDLKLCLDPPAADDRRDRQADVADAVGAGDERGDRQDALRVEGDRVDDLAD